MALLAASSGTRKGIDISEMDDRHHNPSNFDRSPDGAGRDAFERDDAFSEELLSAYLDGECTAGEQAEAEARIAASPELRQLVDDLRNVRASLELLPQHRLEANFAERVLRRAEREVLTGDRTFAQAVAQKAPAVAHRAPSPATSTQLNRRERFGSSRPFLWSVAALAAAILIVITNREPAIEQDTMARGPEAKVAPASKSDNRSADREQPIKLSADPQQDGAARSTEGLPDEKRKLSELAVTADDYSPKAVGPESRSSGISADSKLNRETPDAAASEVEVEATTKNLRSRIQAARSAPNRRSAAPQEPTLPSENQPAAAPPADGVAEGAADLDQGLPRSTETLPPATNGVDLTDADTAFKDAVPAESLRVVQVLVERDAWQSGAITELLKKHRIEVVNATSPDEPTPSSASDPSASVKASERGQSEAKQTVEFARQQALADSLELMVVSAPSAQVAATLDDFRQQDQIRVVQVTDASAPEHFYEESARALDLQRDRRAFAYGSGSVPQTEGVPGDRGGKKEFFESAGAQPADAKLTGPAADTDKKEAQQPSRRAGAKSAPQQAATEKNDAAARRALSKEPAPPSAAARRPASTSAEADEVQMETAPVAPAPSFGAAPGGTKRLDLQPGSGSRGGTARYAVPSAAPTLRGGGFGGYGGARYGTGDTALGKGTSPATAPELPRGYGQRVMLQSPSNYRAIVGGLAGRTVAPAAEAETFSDLPSTTGSLGREQVLFLFHVVDTPLAAAVDRANTASPAEPLEAAKPLPAKAEDTNATPVPAPGPGSASK